MSPLQEIYCRACKKKMGTALFTGTESTSRRRLITADIDAAERFLHHELAPHPGALRGSVAVLTVLINQACSPANVATAVSRSCMPAPSGAPVITCVRRKSRVVSSWRERAFGPPGECGCRPAELRERLRSRNSDGGQLAGHRRRPDIYIHRLTAARAAALDSRVPLRHRAHQARFWASI